MKKNVNKMITEKILNKLTEGVAPWQSFRNAADGFPKRFTGEEYKGINVLLLGMAGYASPNFATFKQAKQGGGIVRKGEKGNLVVFVSKIYKDVNGKIIKDCASVHDPRVHDTHTTFRHYYVFNEEQCDGVCFPKSTTGAMPGDRIHTPIEEAERVASRFLSSANAPELKNSPGTPCYMPEIDEVRIPPPEKFHNAGAYYTALFHELAHSTGHGSRLDRAGITGSRKKEVYAREELIAEIASAFLGASVGLDAATVDNSASYLRYWIDAINGDDTLVTRAAAGAQKAADLIAGE